MIMIIIVVAAALCSGAFANIIVIIVVCKARGFVVMTAVFILSAFTGALAGTALAVITAAIRLTAWCMNVEFPSRA